MNINELQTFPLSKLQELAKVITMIPCFGGIGLIPGNTAIQHKTQPRKEKSRYTTQKVHSATFLFVFFTIIDLMTEPWLVETPTDRRQPALQLQSRGPS